MKRLLDRHLVRWRHDPHRKPVLIRGARQVGKTYGVRKFGRQFAHFAEVNFERRKDAKIIFEKDLVPARIIQELSLFTRQPIIPGKTLLFFDEIQECPAAIQAMRYFYEEVPELHLCAAGSLLDFALEKIGIPVGRISSLYVYPLSFLEFLIATGERLAAEAIIQQKGPLGEAVHSKLLQLVGHYLAIGGMPETVDMWVKTQDPLTCLNIHAQLADTYKQDFPKYAKKHQLKYLDTVFHEIPRQVGKQFRYREIPGEYKKRELAPCLDLLGLANIVHKVYHTAGNGLPLGAERNPEWFKLIYLDVALGQAVLGLDLSNWFLNPTQAFVNKGAIVEAFIGQELLCYAPPERKAQLHFWKSDKPPTQAEIDYLIDYQNTPVPLEVKSTDGRTLKSMRRFLDTHPTSPYGIRFSAHTPHTHENIETRPLYAAATLAPQTQLDDLLALCQE